MDKEDLRKAMQQAQDMQVDLIKAQNELAHTEILGLSRNERVKVIMTAQGDFQSIKIEPALLAEGLSTVEINILEALKDVATKSADLTRARLSQISKSIGL